MNCKVCQEQLDSYLEGSLPEETSRQMEEHLKDCAECGASLSSYALFQQGVDQEKNLPCNPFLSARIMARIEQAEISPVFHRERILYARFLQPAVLTFSIVLILYLGMMIGNSYPAGVSVSEIPVEWILPDDAGIESLDWYLNE